MPERVLVTGAGGFVGSNLAAHLVQEGLEVYCLDSFERGDPQNIHNLKVHFGVEVTKVDMCDRAKLGAYIAGIDNLSCVFHLAAYKQVSESVSQPLLYYRNNLSSTINLLEVLRECKVSSLVFSSSAAIYGDSAGKVVESAPVMPTNPYAQSKLICEKIIADTVASGTDTNAVNATAATSSDYRLRAISLRYFNPLGSDENGLFGDALSPAAQNVMPAIVRTYMNSSRFKLFAGLDTADGTAIRDYIHVSDLVAAHTLCLRRLQSERVSYELFNLGTGEGTSVLELLNTFSAANSLPPADYDLLPTRAGDVSELVADVTEAVTKLDFNCERSLELMCRDAWKCAERATQTNS